MSSGADLTGKIQVRCTAHSLDRNHIGQPGIRINVPANDIQEIDQAAGFEPPRDVQSVSPRQAARQHFIGHVADTEHKLRSNALTDSREHLEGKSQAIVE